MSEPVRVMTEIDGRKLSVSNLDKVLYPLVASINWLANGML